MSNSGYSPPGEFSTVDNVQKIISKLTADNHLQSFINFEEAGRSIFDTQDEDYTDTNFTEGDPELVADGVTIPFTCDDSGGSGQKIPPDGAPLWDPATSKLTGLIPGAVYFISIQLNVKFDTGAGEAQFTTVIEGATIDPIIAANLALEVPGVDQYGLVQPIITFFAPAAVEGNAVRFDVKAVDANMSMAGRSISVYKAFGPIDPNITIEAEDNDDLKVDLHKQAYRNALFSLRTKFERLAVLFGDTRFDGPGGSFQSIPFQTFLKFTVQGAPEDVTNLLASQKNPWDSVNSQLINMQPNGVYLVTCYYQLNSSVSNSGAIFRIRDADTNAIVSGSQTSEDATDDWETYGLTIYFTAPAVTEGKAFEIDFRHENNTDMGDRAISVIQIS